MGESPGDKLEEEVFHLREIPDKCFESVPLKNGERRRFDGLYCDRALPALLLFYRMELDGIYPYVDGMARQIVKKSKMSAKA